MQIMYLIFRIEPQTNTNVSLKFQSVIIHLVASLLASEGITSKVTRTLAYCSKFICSLRLFSFSVVIIV